MLPHLADRPLNLQRFPNGATAPGFWQKDIPSSAPSWLTIWRETGFREREDRAPNDHLVADRAATLCWLGNQAAFEIHAWTSTLHDPVDADLRPHRHRPRDRHDLGARRCCWPGSSGRRSSTSASARTRSSPAAAASRRGSRWSVGATPTRTRSAWVERLSRAIGATVPDLVSWEWAKAERGGRARLDYTQNAAIKTLVAPYAVRPRPGAPVSAPIRWEELDAPDLAPDRWTIRSLVDRVADVGDLWAGLQADDQVLPPL